MSLWEKLSIDSFNQNLNSIADRSNNQSNYLFFTGSLSILTGVQYDSFVEIKKLSSNVMIFDLEPLNYEPLPGAEVPTPRAPGTFLACLASSLSAANVLSHLSHLPCSGLAAGGKHWLRTEATPIIFFKLPPASLLTLTYASTDNSTAGLLFILALRSGFHTCRRRTRVTKSHNYGTDYIIIALIELSRPWWLISLWYTVNNLKLLKYTVFCRAILDQHVQYISLKRITQRNCWLILAASVRYFLQLIIGVC